MFSNSALMVIKDVKAVDTVNNSIIYYPFKEFTKKVVSSVF